MSKEHNHEHEHQHEHHGCDGCCEHCHEHEEEEESKLSLILLAASAALVLISLISMGTVMPIILGIIAVGLSAYPIVISVVKNIKHFSLSEMELMLIAIVAACCLGEFREAAAVGILYRVGEMLEEKAVAKSRKNIDEVTKIQQDFANLLLSDGTVEKVHADDVEVGSLIKVMPYERFPIDGIVTEGISTADASAITGESMPVDISYGFNVKSGMVNGKGAVTVKTTAEFGDSTASRIIRMVEEASERKGKTQKAITKFAKIYTPAVVGFAVIIAIIGSIATKNPAEWAKRALVFLVASCPCALVISIPLGFYAGLGVAAKNGIIVKGSAFAEAFAKARAVVFDKTGTLTTGKLEIDKVVPLNGFNEQQVLALAAAAEHFSSHPIAKSICASAPEIDEALLSDFTETAGNGASVLLAGKRILCGSKKMLAEEDVDVSMLHEGDICIAIEGVAVGMISLKSKVRDSAASMISALKMQGIESAVMLTGDNENAAKQVASECGIDKYFCGLMPEEKIQKLEEIKSQYGGVVYVGDGINDAPVLAAADAGIAMGLGTQAANEAADIILTNDDLGRIAPAHGLFKETVSAMKFNIVFSLAVKLLVLILGAVGMAPIWLAVFADVGVCLICVLVSSMIGTDLKLKK
ncbi:MAG: cadmium-translocating P-type ATPase [Clostridia bacterium]|nr:cadmium-translocating P-type ATPase [Clostridia bacterium]